MTPLSLSQADNYAASIVDRLRPFCELIEIAGSIRRRRPFVNDIDIVVLPHVDQVNALRARVLERTSPVKDGPVEMVVRTINNVQIDLWIANRPKKDLFAETATNFGSLLLCRTGSTAHNIWLVARAEALGRRWNPHHGVFEAGKCLASATEEQIFHALNLDFIPPEKRER